MQVSPCHVDVNTSIRTLPMNSFQVDGCNEKVANMKTEYPALGQALNASGRACLSPLCGLQTKVGA